MTEAGPHGGGVAAEAPAAGGDAGPPGWWAAVREFVALHRAAAAGLAFALGFTAGRSRRGARR